MSNLEGQRPLKRPIAIPQKDGNTVANIILNNKIQLVVVVDVNGDDGLRPGARRKSALRLE